MRKEDAFAFPVGKEWIVELRRIAALIQNVEDTENAHRMGNASVKIDSKEKVAPKVAKTSTNDFFNLKRANLNYYIT